MPKIDLITGFLGSGKTTFIRHYAKYLLSRGERVCILENDYGSINVDALLLNDLLGDNCDLEMVTAPVGDYDCHRRRYKTKLITLGMLGYTRVIVEPSGIYDVDEFFDVLHDDPIDRLYEPGSVLAIVDARLPEKLSDESEYMLVSQTADAGRVILSRTEDASPEEIRGAVAHLNRAMERFKCRRRFSLPENEVPAGNGAAEEHPHSGASDASARSAKMQHPDLHSVVGNEAPASKPLGQQRPDPHNAVVLKDWKDFTDDDLRSLADAGILLSSHVKMPLEDGNGFDSLFSYNVHMTAAQLRETVKKMFNDRKCGHIMRIKGFIPASQAGLKDGFSVETSETAAAEKSESRPAWYEVNATRDGLELKPSEAGQEVLIVIGEHLDDKTVHEYLPSSVAPAHG
ncbi:MAG: GTP-binding protein [Eubacteriales bacterium]|jgi:G3E family GTPase